MSSSPPKESSATPFFSVLVPTYNQAEYLPEALESLRAQTFPDWEAVVVNDGSTDGTRGVMEAYAARDPRIRCIDKVNGGVSSALNEGIENARAEWICWLSSDDYFEPDKLRLHREAIASDPGIRFFFTGFYRLDGKTGARLAPAYAPPPAEYRVVSFLKGNYVHGISIAVHRSVFAKVGPFNAEFHNGQDYDMWLRISALYPSRYIDERTCVTRLHERQDTEVLPDVGVYDSARAAAAFLNTHRFRELFPTLDLARPRDARRAVGFALRIFRSDRSHMHRFGCNPSLPRRIREWLAEACPLWLKVHLFAVYYPGICWMLRRRMPEEIRGELRALRDNWFQDFRFEPWDLLPPAWTRARRMALSGETGESGTLGRYLAKIDPTRGGAAPGGEGSACVNVAMATFNRLDFTRKAIASIIEHTTDVRYVLTVVDNGSVDGTRDYLKSLHEQGIIQNLLLLPANVGVARACNLAWHMEPEAGYYLKIDNDIVICKSGWLSGMVRVADLIPEAGAVAYNFETVSYPVRTVVGLRVRVKARGNLGGACTLIPKRTERLLGYWSEDYGLYAEEDADYGMRIRCLGLFNVYMEDEEVGLHLPAGRAAAIDRRDLSASDGVEEVIQPEYRRFKDALRRSVKGIYRRNSARYRRGTLRLFAQSRFVEEMKGRGFDPLRCRGRTTEFRDLPAIAVAGGMASWRPIKSGPDAGPGRIAR